MLGSHMKDPSQYDLQRVGLKSQPLVTGRRSGLDFRGIHITREVGSEHLSPTASHSMGLDSSDLIRGSLSPYPGYPTVGFSSDVQVFFKYLHPWSLPFFGNGRTPFQIHLLFPLYQPASAVLRPRVESTFTRLTFVPSVPSQNYWRWLIKLKNTALSGAVH